MGNKISKYIFEFYEILSPKICLVRIVMLNITNLCYQFFNIFVSKYYKFVTIDSICCIVYNLIMKQEINLVNRIKQLTIVL